VYRVDPKVHVTTCSKDTKGVIEADSKQVIDIAEGTDVVGPTVG